MGYNRSKSKTSRRVKRAKTNKRNNKRKQTFRKSRRVNRGGKGPQKQSYATSVVKSANQTMKEHAPQPNSLEAKALQNEKNNNDDSVREAPIDRDSKERNDLNATKDEENYNNTLINEENGDYLYAEDPKKGEIVDQSMQLENTKKKTHFNDMMNELLITVNQNKTKRDMDKDDTYNGPEYIGGKKRRTMKRKATCRK